MFIKWSRLAESSVFNWSRPLENGTKWRPFFQPVENQTDSYHSNSERVRYSNPPVCCLIQPINFSQFRSLLPNFNTPIDGQRAEDAVAAAMAEGNAAGAAGNIS